MVLLGGVFILQCDAFVRAHNWPISHDVQVLQRGGCCVYGTVLRSST